MAIAARISHASSYSGPTERGVREGRERERERESTQLLAAPTRKINYVISESRDSPAGLPGTFYWSPSGWALDEVENIPQQKYRARYNAHQDGKQHMKRKRPVIFRFDRSDARKKDVET